jgi:hypothetical protein
MTSPSATLSPPPVLPPAATGGDFPTWLPAMLVKELRQGLRTKGFVGAFIVFQVIMVLLMLGTVLGSAFADASARAGMAATINGFFWTLLAVQLLLVTPGRALGSLQIELESRSLDLLMLTRLTAWRIVLGKWGSLLAQALLLFIAMLPYGIVRYFIGSVDLVRDAYISAALLGGCALMTAAGLAGSGMPKAARILVPIVVVLSFQIVPVMLMATGGRSMGRSPFAALGADTWLLWLNGTLVLGIFLVATVRRIAPPAENHVLLSRGLALATLLPVPLLTAMGRMNGARGQFVFAAFVIALVAATELASMRWPMAAHWRAFVARGRAGRWAGRFALPGWPSGFAFVVLGGILVALCCFLPGLAGGGSGGATHLAWLVALGVVGLVFPAVLLSFFGRSGRAPVALYILVLAVSCLIAAMAGAIGSIMQERRDFLEVASVLPGAGFWITLVQPRVVSDAAMAFQGFFGVAVLGGAWWQSRIYWKHVAKIDAHVRAGKA